MASNAPNCRSASTAGSSGPVDIGATVEVDVDGVEVGGVPGALVGVAVVVIGEVVNETGSVVELAAGALVGDVVVASSVPEQAVSVVATTPINAATCRPLMPTTTRRGSR